MSSDVQPSISPPVRLGDQEVYALALLLSERWLKDDDIDWLLWEDVPMLAESTFEALVVAVKEQVVASIARTLQSYERTHNIDARYLLEQARG